MHGTWVVHLGPFYYSLWKDTCSNPSLGRVTKDSDPSGIKVWVTDQLPRPAKMIVENEEQLEWIVEEEEDDYQLWPEVSYSYKVY